MRIPFYKYQATANDFIIINQMVVPYLKHHDKAQIAQWCDRRLGIGADGLMLINPSESADFEMIYYNSDGGLSTMCGNGGRAISHLANELKIIGKEGSFVAIDGLHQVKISNDRIHLKMSDVHGFVSRGHQYVLDTGSPHHVTFDSNIADTDLIKRAREVRYSDQYAAEGINVNLVESKDDSIHVRTYERGVEDETYSCGTGVVASAIAYAAKREIQDGTIKTKIHTIGGELEVQFTKSSDSYTDIWLVGPQ